jgi:hypothetical protein
MESKPIWLVKIEMPRRFLETFDDRSLEIAGEKLDLGQAQQANEEGLDDSSEAKHQGEELANETADTLPPAASPAG